MTRSRKHNPNRAFTLIEVMLALVLASIVVSTALGVLALVAATQSRNTGDIDETVRLAISQQFFRDTFVRLVAGVPLVQPDETALLEGANGVQNPTDEDEPQAEEGNFESLFDNLIGGGIAAELLSDEAFEFDIMFEVYLDNAVEGWPTPVLECVVTESAVPERRNAFEPELGVLDRLGFARSQLRLEPNGRGSYNLLFLPIDPVGETYTVMRNLEWCEIWVLPSSDSIEWTQVHAAYLEEDFPVAVRIVLWTENGQEVDWLFETQAIIPEAGG